jgi:hypothetical protein
LWRVVVDACRLAVVVIGAVVWDVHQSGYQADAVGSDIARLLGSALKATIGGAPESSARWG